MKNYLKNFSFKDYLYIGLIAILIVATITGIIYRRADRQELDRSKRKLDARAQVQIIHFMALSEGRPLTDKEKETVIRIWREADYDNVAEPPPTSKN